MIKVNNRKGLEASLIPMVNLIFILLIFFLLVTEIKPKEFFVVNPPSSIQELIAGDIKIQLAPATGQRIVKKIGKDKSQKIDLDILPKDTSLLISVDGSSKAKTLAALISDLHSMGFKNINIHTVKK